MLLQLIAARLVSCPFTSSCDVLTQIACRRPAAPPAQEERKRKKEKKKQRAAASASAASSSYYDAPIETESDEDDDY